MKTPEEIKKGLEKEIPVHYHLPNPEPRLRQTELMELQSLHASATTYINQLEETVARQKEKYKRLLENAAILSDDVDELQRGCER